MGYVVMGIATLHPLGLSGAVLQMFSHGIMTALFFAVVGVVYDRTHTRDMLALDGLAKRMPVTAVFFTIAGLTSLGLPGLSGFVAELLVFLGLFKTYPILGMLGIIGAAITAVYILRLLAKVFFGPMESFSLSVSQSVSDGESSIGGQRSGGSAASLSHAVAAVEPEHAEQMDATMQEKVSAAILTAFILLVGLFPFPFMRVINGGVADVLARFG